MRMHIALGCTVWDVVPGYAMLCKVHHALQGYVAHCVSSFPCPSCPPSQPLCLAAIGISGRSQFVLQARAPPNLPALSTRLPRFSSQPSAFRAARSPCLAVSILQYTRLNVTPSPPPAPHAAIGISGSTQSIFAAEIDDSMAVRSGGGGLEDHGEAIEVRTRALFRRWLCRPLVALQCW